MMTHHLKLRMHAEHPLEDGAHPYLTESIPAAVPVTG